MNEATSTRQSTNILRRPLTYISESRVFKAIGNFCGRIVTKVIHIFSCLTGHSKQKNSNETAQQPSSSLDERRISPAIPPQSASSVSKIIANPKTTATGIQHERTTFQGQAPNTQVAPQSNTAMSQSQKVTDKPKSINDNLENKLLNTTDLSNKKNDKINTISDNKPAAIKDQNPLQFQEPPTLQIGGKTITASDPSNNGADKPINNDYVSAEPAVAQSTDPSAHTQPNVDLESGKSASEITGNNEKVATYNSCHIISHEEQKSKTEARLQSTTTVSQSQKATGNADVFANPQVTKPGQTIPLADELKLVSSNETSKLLNPTKPLNIKDDKTHATAGTQLVSLEGQLQSQVSSTVQIGDEILGTIFHKSNSSEFSVVIENPEAVFPSGEGYANINVYLRDILKKTRNIIDVVNTYNISRKDENEDYNEISVIYIPEFITDSDLKKFNTENFGNASFVHNFISNAIDKPVENLRKNPTINAIKIIEYGSGTSPSSSKPKLPAKPHTTDPASESSSNDELNNDGSGVHSA